MFLLDVKDINKFHKESNIFWCIQRMKWKINDKITQNVLFWFIHKKCHWFYEVFMQCELWISCVVWTGCVFIYWTLRNQRMKKSTARVASNQWHQFSSNHWTKMKCFILFCVILTNFSAYAAPTSGKFSLIFTS